MQKQTEKYGLTAVARSMMLLAAVLLLGCRSGGRKAECDTVDSLNTLAYRWQYRNIDSAESYASRAYKQAAHYSAGRAEALNVLGFVDYQKMDYASGRRHYTEAQKITDNQVVMLASDIGMMRLCQRTSANKEFFDHRNSALRRIKRIKEEEKTLPLRTQRMFSCAQNEFHLVSVTYYLQMEQSSQARSELAKIDPNDDELLADTAQLAHYYYLAGNRRLVQSKDDADFTLLQVNNLIHCLTMSYLSGNSYYEGAALQSFAEMMCWPKVPNIIKQYRKTVFSFLNDKNLPDSLLPNYLANRALDIFKKDNDRYHTADAYRTLALCSRQLHKYEDALNYLDSALSIVNQHHEKYYAQISNTHPLQFFNATDTVSVEEQWLSDPRIETDPNWIANIREQLSVTFGGLNEKQLSDYNRNIYYDILEVTRQDRELESLSEELNHESKVVNGLLLLVVLLLLALVAGLVLFNRSWHRRDRRHLAQLRQTLDLCREITSSTTAEEDSQITAKLPQDKALRGVLKPYLEWAGQNRELYRELGDERERLQEEYAVHQLHIAENKRQNVEKRAKLSLVYGIMPYLDRIINEVNKLETDTAHRAERLEYICELVARINDYNDILAQWIQLNQGELSLHVESFALGTLFDILGKSRRSFELKNLTLDITYTNAFVKADKVLTLFMINTLADNARKFTPAGGKVHIFADETDSFVEISVQDTGVGLTDEEIRTILDTKVYDAKLIGAENAGKGHGFGLMNCKGIIEKYRKTSPLFSVCCMGIESSVGAGSRFFFRLPKAVRKTLASLCVLVAFAVSSCTSPAVEKAKTAERIVPHDTLLVQARQYADSCYNCNIVGNYARMADFADSAVHYFNAYYLKQHPKGKDLMVVKVMSRNIQPAEIKWWNDGFATDYDIILFLRNEIAVAALAVHKTDVYLYNNYVYRQLYLLRTQGQSLGPSCQALKRSNSNRQVGLVLLMLLIAFIVAGYYFIIFRRKILFRLNLRQVLEVNRQVLGALSGDVGAEDIERLPQRMLQRIFPYINEIHAVGGLAVQLHNEEGKPTASAFEGDREKFDVVSRLLTRCHAESRPQLSPDGSVSVYPLLLEGGEKQACIGAFAFVAGAERFTENDRLLDELMVRYMAIVLFQTVVRRQRQYDTLEVVEDEKRRAEYEESQLHVQNMVLDNCLSTLKHETMYYPNRIRQLVEQMQENPQREDATNNIEAIHELVDYYKLIFNLLSGQASRQLEQVNFRREIIFTQELLSGAKRYFERLAHKRGLQVRLVLQQPANNDLAVCGDREMLRVLLENLVQGSFRNEGEGEFLLSAIDEAAFVRFSFTDRRQSLSDDKLNDFFSPDIDKIPYLLCKQIVRDHDEFSGHCGCRINAEAAEGGGVTVWFTIPKNRKKNEAI